MSLNGTKIGNSIHVGQYHLLFYSIQSLKLTNSFGESKIFLVFLKKNIEGAVMFLK